MTNPTSVLENSCVFPAPVEYTTLSVEEQQLILQLQQDILVSVAHGGETKDIINQICLLAEQLLPNSVATVMLLDQAREYLNVYASPSVPPDGVARLNQLRPGPGGGSCGNAVFRNEPQFVQNTFEDPRWQDLRQLAYDFNLCACWSTPIVSPDGKAIGSFALSSFEHRTPSSFHRKILEMGASIVGIVLERARSQEALHVSEQKYQRLIEDVGDKFVVFTHSVSGELRYASAGIKNVFGVDNDQAIGKPWASSVRWKPGVVDYTLALLSKLESGEKSFIQYEMQFTHPDGSERTIQVSKHAVRDTDGQVVSFDGIIEDITDRKIVEERIARDREMQAILRELLEISLAPQPLKALLQQCLERLMMISWLSFLPKSGVFLMEEDGRSLKLVASHEFSRQILSLCDRVKLGECLCGQAAATGKLLYSHCVDDRHSVRYEGMADHGHYNVPLKFDNKVLGVLVLYLPLDYQHNDQNGQFIMSVADILAGLISRKQAEQALITHQEQLEKLVDMRTAELEAAKNAAEAASLAKSAFLANMSHELRTPLQTIIGAEHMVRKESLTPNQTQWLDKQLTAGEHLLDVINDILDLSRIEADKVELEDEHVNVLTILQNVSQLIESRAQAKGLYIRIDAQSMPQKLHGDNARLRQALLNYAGNAVKFTEEGEILLRSSLINENADSVTLRFEVIDTGIGIDSDVIERLFSAFEQADNSLTRQYGGTGLGLAITKQLAQLMGGDAGVESTQGQGSIFWFTARLRKETESHQFAASTLEADEQADELLRTRYAGKRILVAEDEPANQGLFRELLKDVNLDVTIAKDGAQAVELATEQCFDIVLMDMQMPRLDGLEATQQIRAKPNGANVPILAMTGNAFAEDRERCITAGMSDFLAKPVLADALYTAIATWLAVGENQD